MSVVGKAGYKETAIGWIPNDWNLGSVGSVVKVANGNAFKSLDFKPDGIPILRISNINFDYSIDVSDAVFYDEDAKLERFKVNYGDFVVAMSGATTGKIGRYLGRQYCYLNQRVGRFDVIQGMANPDYVFQFLIQDSTQEQILAAAAGGAQPNISGGTIEALPMPIPPLPEQEKIAAILTAVDDKLDVIARQIRATNTLKRGLMQTLFSQGVGTQDPTDWPTVPLCEVAHVRTGVAKGKKGLTDPVNLPYLRVANVQDGHIDLSEVKNIEVEATQVERYSLQVGDMLMTEGGDFDKLGRGDVWDGQIAPCLHQNHVFAVRPNPEKLNSYYLAALAASDVGRQYFLSCAKRTTNLASINSSQLKAFPVLLPSLQEQERIAEMIAGVNSKLSLLSNKQTHYQTLKRGLMQKLLTGEWRVKVA